jgi:thiamine pyrophosphokinase
MLEFLIVANGPFLPKDIILEASKNGRIIIALDGACDKLAKIGIMPHVILGDFDSVSEVQANFFGIKNTFNHIDEESACYIGNYGIKIVPAKNQDSTDLAKAIQYCDKHNAAAIDIVCAVGGDRMDHTIANMRILRTAHQPQRSIRLLTEGQVLTFARNQNVLIQGEINDYCGIIAAPEGSFSSQGLAYNGDNYKLTFGSDSTSNQLKEPVAHVNITGDVIIIHPPQLEAQRKFIAMSSPERLSCLMNEQKNTVHQITANDIRHAKAMKRIVKENLTIPSKKTMAFFRKEPSVIYLSHQKSDLLDEHKMAHDEKILVCMSEKKFKEFNFFKQLKVDDVSKKHVGELITQIQGIFSHAMPSILPAKL